MSEQMRLQQSQDRQAHWKRWGPYLPDRQWSTVREDYSAGGNAWQDFDHDMARSRTYRWGEDGLLGWCDRQCRLCFSVALWNGQDPFLKERLFGLTGPEGNHGEDVKECYYFLDSTPTHSYCKALYRYPQQAFPYQELRHENAARSRQEDEYELEDSGALEETFDCYIEYAKEAPDDTLIRITVLNRGSRTASLTLLPTLWFRNTWAWGRVGEGYTGRPEIVARPGSGVQASHESLGEFDFFVEGSSKWLFTENETNRERLYGQPNSQPYVKDAFHRYLVEGEQAAVNPALRGTKAAALLRFELDAGEEVVIRCRLSGRGSPPEGGRRGGFDPGSPLEGRPFGKEFDHIIARRIAEAEDFYAPRAPRQGSEVWRQALAGLLWSKKFYYYDVAAWLEGDPVAPPPPPQRRRGRNTNWACHLYNRDLMLMPDAWEYPWYAAWDTAFHVIPLAQIDPELAKQQLLLLVREWYQHPNGQIPAYEWNFNDVNPPVHAWSAWQVYRRDGSRDRLFLERMFHKLLLNFTWWVNRTDHDGNSIFSGGFLGMDNIGIFDRSHLPPGLGELEQADATAWMAFYCISMLHIAMELASQDGAYEDIASKFFEHFVAITHSMNSLGLWDEEDGFFYDVLHIGERFQPLKVRSLVGLLPLIAVDRLAGTCLQRLPAFRKRLEWFVANRPHLAQHLERQGEDWLLAVVTRDRLKRLLERMLDRREFLSDYGIRSLSRYHREHPYQLRLGGRDFEVGYEPGESQTPLFGGNSNWRGPIWFPINFLLIEALEEYHRFYGNRLKVPSLEGSGNVNLGVAAQQIRGRLCRLFLEQGPGPRYFHEYFHGDTGRGLGATHQTGWTALIATLLEELN